MRRFQRVPTIYVLSKSMKIQNCQNNLTENYHFTAVKNRCILHGHVFVMVFKLRGLKSKGSPKIHHFFDNFVNFE